MLERHPLGSQAFIPIDPHGWWVVVASTPDAAAVRVFRARGTEGVNYRAGTWHHPLLVDRPQRFLVIDRGGEGDNLEEARARDHGALDGRLRAAARTLFWALRRCPASSSRTSLSSV